MQSNNISYHLCPGVMWFSAAGAHEEVNTLVSESCGHTHNTEETVLFLIHAKYFVLTWRLLPAVHPLTLTSSLQSSGAQSSKVLLQVTRRQQKRSQLMRWVGWVNMCLELKYMYINYGLHGAMLCWQLWEQQAHRFIQIKRSALWSSPVPSVLLLAAVSQASVCVFLVPDSAV